MTSVYGPKRQHTDTMRIYLAKLRAEPRWVKERKAAAALDEYAQGGGTMRQLADKHGVSLDTLRCYMYRVEFDRAKAAERALCSITHLFLHPKVGEFLSRYDELHPQVEKERGAV